MDLSLSLQRDLARWYALIDHPVQLALVNDEVRFKVVPAGRRSGKTERLKRFIAKTAMRNPNEKYFLAAPTRDQVKKIYWADMKRLALCSMQSKRPSETELMIPLDNGTEIHLIGLDRPERMEGQFWSGGGIDEIADVKPEAWESNIRPALDTFNPLRPDYRAWCWLIGVPDGLNHFYDMAEYARTANDPDWKLYAWKSSEILPEGIIAAAKRQMSLKQYRQEYEATFETATGRIYEDYSSRNYTTETIAPHEQLCWYHDFNYTPLSSGIGVRRENAVLLLDEIILTSAVARQSAMEFVSRYETHQNRTVVVYGDPSGQAGEKHGQTSNYKEIVDYLQGNGWVVDKRVKPKAPAIRDRQNAVRAKISNAAGEVSLFVNPGKAVYTHKGLATVSTKKGSAFLEEETDYQHITTAVGYFLDYEFPVSGNSMLKLGISGN